MKISQREAVFQAVKNAFNEAGIEFRERMNVSDHISEAMTVAIKSEVTEGFHAGVTFLKDTEANRAKLTNPAEMSKYVSGLLSNWTRKDERLNGGIDYEPKNPGSRAGSSDPQLKALKGVAAKFKAENNPKLSEVLKLIETRTATIATEKAKKITVDITQIPAELRKTLGLE